MVRQFSSHFEGSHTVCCWLARVCCGWLLGCSGGLLPRHLLPSVQDECEPRPGSPATAAEEGPGTPTLGVPLSGQPSPSTSAHRPRITPLQRVGHGDSAVILLPRAQQRPRAGTGGGSSLWQRLGHGAQALVASCAAGSGGRSCAAGSHWHCCLQGPAVLCLIRVCSATFPTHRVWHHSGLARVLCSFTHVV